LVQRREGSARKLGICIGMGSGCPLLTDGPDPPVTVYFSQVTILNHVGVASHGGLWRIERARHTLCHRLLDPDTFLNTTAALHRTIQGTKVDTWILYGIVAQRTPRERGGVLDA
jgi:hypothetical protein